MLTHLACIMDGNRRWARGHSLAPWLGHKEGVNAAKRVISFCLKNGIRHLSLYTFSIENLRRSEQEQSYLFKVLAREVKDEIIADSLAHGIQVCFVGDRALFPEPMLSIIQEMEEKTAHLDKLRVNLLFCYGGQQEIVAAAQSIIARAMKGELDPATLTAETFSRYLWTGDVPVPDLILRTGGVHRISNFLLYQGAYSEMIFLDCFWPEITDEHLNRAIEDFNSRQRNFGL